jgi:GNAT superfamily N-acetyltransferase
MPIEGISQPEILQIDSGLRLRRFDGQYTFAFDWYQDAEMVYLVDGVKRPYSFETLTAMYAYLNRHGELYFIEARCGDEFVPVGDVTFWQNDMPIVIGDPAFRGRGLGRKVIAALIERARSLGFSQLRVGEIYDWNPASQKCFMSLGFVPVQKTEKGSSYVLKL